MELPRVLLLTNEPPQTVGAGSIIFHRLFSNYPPDRLRVITNVRPPPVDQRLACHYAYLPLAADRLNRTRLWPWRAVLRNLGASRLTGLRRVDEALQGFTPDVVATLMQDSWYYDLAARYARRRKLPFVLLAHDVAHGFEPVPPWLQPRQLRRDAAVYRQAKVRLCISPGMLRYHEEVFGAPGEVLLPPRSDNGASQSPEACRQLKQSGILTLGYAGGLHYGYGEQLLRMLPVLRETGTMVELFGPKPGGSISSLNDATDVFHFNGYLSPPEVAWGELLRRCDAVLQPYLNPPGAHELQYRTHFPSKLGDCLALGLPLLITGPAYASGVSWCRQHPDCAMIVTDPAQETLAAGLRQLRDDPALRVHLAEQAQSRAVAFDAPALRKRLQVILTTLPTPRPASPH